MVGEKKARKKKWKPTRRKGIIRKQLWKRLQIIKNINKQVKTREQARRKQKLL